MLPQFLELYALNNTIWHKLHCTYSYLENKTFCPSLNELDVPCDVPFLGHHGGELVSNLWIAGGMDMAHSVQGVGWLGFSIGVTVYLQRVQVSAFLWRNTYRKHILCMNARQPSTWVGKVVWRLDLLGYGARDGRHCMNLSSKKRTKWSYYNKLIRPTKCLNFQILHYIVRRCDMTLSVLLYIQSI